MVRTMAPSSTWVHIMHIIPKLQQLQKGCNLQVSSRRTMVRTMAPSSTSVSSQMSLKGTPLAQWYTTCTPHDGHVTPTSAVKALPPAVVGSLYS